jgi:multicomponent Na+:H+ antiporter subunit D
MHAAVHLLVPLPVVVPLSAAAILAALNSWLPRRLADAIALLASGSTMVFCWLLMRAAHAQPITYWFGGWTPRSGGVAIGIAFEFGPLSAGLAAFAALLVLAALVFSLQYFESEGTLFHSLMLAFLGAMCGFSLTGDLFNLFVFFELMSAAAFALCGYKNEEPQSMQGALNFAVTNTIGAFFTLTGIALFYGKTGALNLAQIGHTLAGHTDALVVVAFTFVACGFLVKAAVVPFHFWLADAHAVAPTPVCILFSGVMVELGLYAVARVYWTLVAWPQNALSPSHTPLRGLLLVAGALTAIVGAMMCFGQRHLKRLLAFSTVSHVGLMLLGIAALTPEGLAGTAQYVIGHGCAKSALFIVSGILLHRYATVDPRFARHRYRLCHRRARALRTAAVRQLCR